MIAQPIIKLSEEVLVVAQDHAKEVYVIDAKTLGTLATLTDDCALNVQSSLAVSATFGYVAALQHAKNFLNVWDLTPQKHASGQYSSSSVQFRTSLQERITACLFTHSQLYFVSAAAAGTLYLWETLTGHLLVRHRTNLRQISALAFSEDDGALAAADDSGTVSVYLTSALFTFACQLHKDVIAQSSLHSTPLLSASDNGLQVLTAHTQKVTSLQWLGGASKNLLVSVSLDKSAVVWDAYRGTKLASHHLDSEINCSVLLSTLSHSSSTLLYVGCQNRNLYEVALFTNGIAEIGNKRQATMHYNVLQDGDVQKLQHNLVVTTAQQHKCLSAHTESVTCVALLQEAHTIVSGDKQGVILFWHDNTVVKRYAALKGAPIGKIVSVPRPKEFFTANALLQMGKKKPQYFKPFAKFEQKAEEVSLLPQRILSSKTAVCDKEGVSAKSIFQASFTAFLSEGAAGAQRTAQEPSMEAENERLKAINHKLFVQSLHKNQ